MKIDYNLAWRYLNEVCFDGELTHTKIHCFKGSIWGYDADQLLVGSYHPGSREILLHTGKYIDSHEGGPLEALYHEMVHQYIDEVLEDDESPDHGKLFWSIYTEGLKKLNKRGDVPLVESEKMKKKAKGKKPPPAFGKGQAGRAPPGIKKKGTKKTDGESRYS